MFPISGRPTRLCDGIQRRELLRLGGLAAAGLSLPELLAREARSSVTARARQCLLIYMEGGPSHIDLFDMKPDAPAEVRGELRPIATRVAGTHISELLPLLSRHMHRLTQVRSMTHTITDHNAGTYYALTGKYPLDGARLVVADGPRNFPNYGAVLAKLRPTGQPLPDSCHAGEVMSNLNVDIAGQSAGFLGPAYDPLVTGDPSLPHFEVPGMKPSPEVSVDRLAGRTALVRDMDRKLGSLADDPAIERLNLHYRKAIELIGSQAARQAFDLDREPRQVRERYGLDPGTDRSIEARKFGGLPHLGQSALLARRLLEAGVRLVTLVTGRRIDQAWDTHRDHFGLLRQSLCPMFDRSVSALLEDLAERGLLDETLVVIMGEFGRTPRLGYVTSGAGATKNGRDHWPFCYTVLFAGAGIKPGMIHGASDRQAAFPSRDPYKPEDLAATIYEIMGIPADTVVQDSQGQPHHLIRGTPIQPILS
jgi:hypothetical protein